MPVKVKCAHTEMRDTGKVKPNPRNPNTHPEDQIERLAAIIKAHGWRHPITVSKRSGLVVAGHGRLLAAQRLNLTRVPVDIQPFKNKAEETAVLMADNFIAELAETDALQVRELLVELNEADYPLELVGLTEEDLAEYLDDGEEDPPEAPIPEKPKKPKTKPGQIILLGDHILMCGDSTNDEDVERLMGGKKAGLVHADTPYGVSVVPTSGKIGGSVLAKNQTYRPVIGDDSPPEVDILLKMSPNLILWGANYFPELLPSRGQWIVWDKGRPSGTTFSDCELAWTSRDGIAIKMQRCVWHGMIREGEKGERLHPTQKPIMIIAWALSMFEAELIVDPYVGSGTTIMAAESLRRRCYAMEIDPGYCDVTIERWENETGKKAKRQK